MRGISSDTSLSSSQRAVKMQKYLEGLGKSDASFANDTGILGTDVSFSNNMNLKGDSPAHNPANYNHKCGRRSRRIDYRLMNDGLRLFLIQQKKRKIIILKPAKA